MPQRHALPSCTVMVMKEWGSCHWTRPEYTHQFASTASGPAFLGPFLISILLPGTASFFYSPVKGKDLLITKPSGPFPGLLLLMPLAAFTTDYTFLPQTPLPQLLRHGSLPTVLPLSDQPFHSSSLKAKHSPGLWPWPCGSSTLLSVSNFSLSTQVFLKGPPKLLWCLTPSHPRALGATVPIASWVVPPRYVTSASNSCVPKWTYHFPVTPSFSSSCDS